MIRLVSASSLLALSLVRQMGAANAQSAIQDIKEKAERIVAPLTGSKDDRLQEVAKFDHQVTGATVAEDGRIFVNFRAGRKTFLSQLPR